MHASLHQRNILRLPGNLRRVANSAANGSLNDLQSLGGLIPGLPASTALLFLPVFYVNLDPAGIPNMDDIGLNTHAMACALASTEGIYFLQNPGKFLPDAAVIDIWPRYWAWIECFQIYATMTSGRPSPSLGLREFELGSNVVQFMASFHNSQTLFKLFGATPGVRVLLARNWSLLVQREAGRARDVGLDQVLQCVNGSCPIDASEPAGLEEFVEGAGGTINDLASLIIQSITALIPSRKPPITRLPLKFVGAILAFVIATDRISESRAEDDESLFLLCSALCEGGFVKTLTTVMHNLADNTIPGVTETLATCLVLFRVAFLISSGDTWAGQALKAGLLRPLLVEEALLEIEDVVQKSPLAKTESWTNFVNLAQERISIRQVLDSSDCIWSGACDNMACAVIRDRPTLKRCVNCKTAYYCSKLCQIMDWAAGHRKACSRGHSISLDQISFGRRERAFIRTIVQQDYEAHKANTIYPEQVRFMAQSPHEYFFTFFDYSWGRVRIEVRFVTCSPIVKDLESAGEEWCDLLSRARDSAGRMELHVVDIGGIWVVPLRTNSSCVYEGMRSIATSLPPAVTSQADSPSLLEAVQAVLDEEKDHFRAIH
ncbi:MYND-type domain-containing protein [Mycena venus]|uniref:MYND-type domain-containing protein n=1 Tax=Mycena venus TaxID=2733690 RepID=A0A8H7CGR9_9AGAR|nr:MYND-type domain-containing protein [Mycena venus]